MTEPVLSSDEGIDSLEGNSVLMRVEDLSLRYRTRAGFFGWTEHTVFEGVNFELYRGETLGIVGRNGCGKSSLLRLLCGVINPSGGRIVVVPGVRRALLSLGLGFKPDLSGRDNALLSMMLQGMSKTSAMTYLNDIADFAELGNFFYQPVKIYSSGMRARLGFATALKTDVDLLLIDETLSVGDVGFRAKAEAAIKNKIKGKLTVLLVSHNEKQIAAMCDRVFWLDKGALKYDNDTEWLLGEYANKNGKI